MKKTILFVVAIAGISLCSFAQVDVDIDDEPSQNVLIKNKGEKPPKQTPEDRAKRNSEKLKQKLDLSEDQTAKVYKLSLLRAQKMDQLRAREDSEKKAKWEQARQIQAENDSALKKEVFTAEQFAMYRQMQEEKKQMMKDHHGKGHQKGQKKSK